MSWTHTAATSRRHQQLTAAVGLNALGGERDARRHPVRQREGVHSAGASAQPSAAVCAWLASHLARFRCRRCTKTSVPTVAAPSSRGHRSFRRGFAAAAPASLCTPTNPDGGDGLARAAARRRQLRSPARPHASACCCVRRAGACAARRCVCDAVLTASHALRRRRSETARARASST